MVTNVTIVFEQLEPNINRTLKRSIIESYFDLQAIYNLAYIVEYNYSLNGIHWTNVAKNDIVQGNLTFAALLYEK